MTSLPLVPNHDVFNKHTHTRTKLDQKGWGFSNESVDSSFLYSPLQTMHNLLDAFPLVEFDVKYSRDIDAHTEYIKLTGKDEKDVAIEIHIFSCYCDGEPVGQPPF